MTTEIKPLNKMTLHTVNKIEKAIYKRRETLNNRDDNVTNTHYKTVEKLVYAEGRQASLTIQTDFFGTHYIPDLLEPLYSNLRLWNVFIHARENKEFIVELTFALD